MAKRRLVIILIVLFLISVTITACRRAGYWLIKSDIPAKSDAILLLMGSLADRVLETSDLYNKKLADKVFVVEENMNGSAILKQRGVDFISNSQQAKSILTNLGIPSDSIIIIPGEAKSTLDEAIALMEYLSVRTEIDTLIIVTSSFHSRRAAIIFKRVFDFHENQVVVFSNPSSYTHFSAGKWWRNKENIQAVLTEYLKLFNFYIFENRR